MLGIIGNAVYKCAPQAEPARQNPVSLWIGLDELGFGAGRQVELTNPGGVRFFLQGLLPFVRGPGTSRVRPGAVFMSGNPKPPSRWGTYSAKVSLSMQYIGAGQIK